jgi:hypothetical protein
MAALVVGRARTRSAPRRGDRGVVGVDLVLVVAFALYAVIMLARTTLAAKQIDDRVRVIVTEVGPGSNVSRLDETQKLNSIARTAEEILAASRPLSGQAQIIIDTARSIDRTASGIEGNANEINATVKSINTTAAVLLPVVRDINGDGSFDAATSGVAGINMRADTAIPIVAGISDDLGRVSTRVGAPGSAGHAGANVHRHVNSINCAVAGGLNPQGLGALGAVGSLLGGVTGASPGCNQF